MALEDPIVQFAGTVDAQRVGPLRTLCLDSARVEIATPRTMLESMQLTRVGSAEIARYRDGISGNKPLARVAALVGTFDRTVAPPPGSIGFNQILASYEEFSRTAMGFVWLSTPTARHAAAGTQRSAEVSAGRTYMRLQLKATELGLRVHPMSQARRSSRSCASTMTSCTCCCWVNRPLKKPCRCSVALVVAPPSNTHHAGR
ncbi:MAG: hypothetical protein LH632_08420 [Rhodoferax sp.]|nr:hypothetical protein [Rhodoferax sp.]